MATKLMMITGASLVLTQVFAIAPSWPVAMVGFGVTAIGALLYGAGKEADRVRNN